MSFHKIKYMKTHKAILSAIWALVDYEPLSVKVPFRGMDIVRMDAYGIEAYKIGNSNPLIVEWEDITAVEALRIKRACRYTLDKMQQDAEKRLSKIMDLVETFEKSPFGC